MNKRYFIGKKPQFDSDKKDVFESISKIIDINIEDIEIYIGYDAINLEHEKEFLDIIYSKVTDIKKVRKDLKGTLFAYELLPGQYDKKSDAVKQSLNLYQEDKTEVTTSTVVEIKKELSTNEIESIYKLLINPIECRIKDLNQIGIEYASSNNKMEIIENFIQMNNVELKTYFDEGGFSFEFEDLEFIQEYFKTKNRNPNLLEIKMLDTYWSDHCRHTTFLTELQEVEFGASKETKIIKKAWNSYIKQRGKLGREKAITLMDIATHGTRVLKSKNLIDDLEESSEINANSFRVKVDEDNKNVEYLLMFKNETHNHPTEIEPFGGASTCLGGAIRDTLSGRAYTYQGMRITGSGNPLNENTLPNKLSQAYITKTAAKGFSSYGNQIGMATTNVKEYYNEGFVAKRMEVGFVVGAVKASEIKREEPVKGDIVMLVGGATGRDGIGGATGSSKQQTKNTSKVAAAEVQKGNAIVERKLQKLTKNHIFTNLIKKSNDFGAGGISVAVVELASAIEIQLDKMPLKYKGLSPMEIALSESQERMAYVIKSEDQELFERLCQNENLVSTHIATIVDNGKVTMKYGDEIVLELDSSFVASNGKAKKTNVIIDEKWNLSKFQNKKYSIRKYIETLNSLKVASQKGLQEMFDSSIGRGTVVSPYGGVHQATPSQISAQKIPTKGFTNTASVASHGYAPDLAVVSPYLASQYSVVTSISKLVSSGVPLKHTKASYQEYFERMINEKSWSKPIQSLLGTLEPQILFEVPSIGGKDSMSGTYNDINVPPTLIAFAINVAKTKSIVTSELKEKNSKLYLIDLPKTELMQINLKKTKKIFTKLEKLIKNNKILSSSVVEEGGWLTALTKMSFGNRIGFKVENNKLLEDAFSFNNGSIIIETQDELEIEHFEFIGKTANSIIIQNEKYDIKELNEINEETLESIFPLKVKVGNSVIDRTYNARKEFKFTSNVSTPKVLIPVFPGSNCEDDLQKAFEVEEAKCKQLVINNINNKLLKESQEKFVKELSDSQILCIPGGFSATDEPDGSGKFISIFMKSPIVKKAIEKHIEDKKLIIGICNGFQALIKTGLVPYGKFIEFQGDEPILYKNLINKHVSRFATTRVTSNNSPWTSGFKINETHTLPMSHGEGRVIINKEQAKILFSNGQIPFQYVDLNNEVTMHEKYNPNSSMFAIEGMTSKDGLILGKMSHTERYEPGNFKNIYGNKEQQIIKNSIKYFKGE